MPLYVNYFVITGFMSTQGLFLLDEGLAVGLKDRRRIDVPNPGD